MTKQDPNKKIFNHKEIEQKWQSYWDENNIYKTKDKEEGKENYYILVEFPYPSGNLHVGHWYAFAVTDILARYKRMLGKNVLYPIGFDAFGLPAENAAIKRGVNPRKWTESNIDYMTKQLKSMGASFDWSRKIETIDPRYYRWTQWMFLQFFKAGLAEQKQVPANWCPSCKTTLANEQVINGKCERCDSEVDKKELKQWVLKITKYADRLIDDLDELDWPEEIKKSQKEWIGRSHGAEIDFAVEGREEKIRVFTTRPDTIFGASYMVLAPEHALVKNWLKEGIIENKEEVEKYINEAKKKSEIDRTNTNKEKTGVKLEGIVAINPARKKAGMDKAEIPIFIADYVLAHYGTGAIMAVPAHDERDFDFAKKYNLDIAQVIDCGELPCAAPGALLDSGPFDGMNSEEAKEKITEYVEGEMTKTYRLRDWVVSRQRYWGVPIPILLCDSCGAVAEKEENLPVKLPETDDYLPSDDGKSPLAKKDEFVNTTCPQCGAPAKRETDTLDTFVDSSWYFLRYLDPKNDDQFLAKEKEALWMPVDFYSGGAEHTTMHLLYSRFWHKALFDLGLVKDKEPYKARLNRGLIMGPDGQKMSKSKGNVVDPDEVVENVGSDTVRSYLAFIGPYNEPGHYPWNPDGVVSIRRFLERVYGLQFALKDTRDAELEKLLHKTIKKVRQDSGRLKFNTAISSMMVFAKEAEKQGIDKEQFELFVKLLAPFAPHLAEELWQGALGKSSSVHKENYPDYNEELTRDEKVKIGVQINGKLRAEIEISPDANEQEARQLALEDERVKKHTEGKEIRKLIYIPGKIINIVI